MKIGMYSTVFIGRRRTHQSANQIAPFWRENSQQSDDSFGGNTGNKVAHNAAQIYTEKNCPIRSHHSIHKQEDTLFLDISTIEI
jgi:hypothetical protein